MPGVPWQANGPFHQCSCCNWKEDRLQLWQYFTWTWQSNQIALWYSTYTVHAADNLSKGLLSDMSPPPCLRWNYITWFSVRRSEFSPALRGNRVWHHLNSDHWDMVILWDIKLKYVQIAQGKVRLQLSAHWIKVKESHNCKGLQTHAQLIIVYYKALDDLFIVQTGLCAFMFIHISRQQI